jgi:hypothetical protein
MGGKRKVDSEVVKVRMYKPDIARTKDLQTTDSEWKYESWTGFLGHLCVMGMDALERRSKYAEGDKTLPRTGRRSLSAVGKGKEE